VSPNGTPGRESARSAAPPADPAIPVTAGVARAENVPVYVQGIGTVQAINTVNVKSRVDGAIVAALFKQGQEVKQGRQAVPDRSAAISSGAEPGEGQRGEGCRAVARRTA